MLQVRQLFEPPAPRARMAIGEGLAWATGEMLRTRGTAWSVLITIAMSAPLYMLNYDSGAHPMLGFWMAMVLGALAAGASMGAMVGTLMGRGLALVFVGMAIQVRAMVPLVLTFGAACTAVMLGWRELVALGLVPPELVSEYFLNTWSGAWKPLGQVSAIAVLYMSMTPFAALSVPAVGGAETPIGETMAWMRRQLHHKMYSAFSLGGWLMAMAGLAMVPWVGLLAVPVSCLLLVRVFHYSFERREDWQRR